MSALFLFMKSHFLIKNQYQFGAGFNMIQSLFYFIDFSYPQSDKKIFCESFNNYWSIFLFQ